MRKGVIRLVTFVEQKSSRITWIIALMVLFAGIGYSLYLGNEVRYLPDEQDYFTLSAHLTADFSYSLDGEQPTAYRAPGYPLLLALLRLFGADIVHFRVLNYILLLVCILIVHQTLKTRFSPLAGVLGASFAALYPVFFYTAGTLYPQTLASFLFLLFIYLVSSSPIRDRDFWFAGLIFGYLVLTVPSFITVLPVICLWLFFAKSPGWLKSSIILVITSSLVIGIWTVRNYLAFDTFVFISSNSGENLLLGNSENTRPNAGHTVDISRYEREAAGMGEIERDRFYMSKAIEYISTHKAETVQMYFRKLLNYFNYRNELVTKQEESSLKDLVMLLTFGPALFAFTARLFLIRVFKPSSLELLLFLLFIANAFFAAVFFTRIRFRLPFDFLLIMLVAIFIERLFITWTQRKRLNTVATTV